MFTLKTLPAVPDRSSADVAETSGFSLHAGVAAKAGEQNKLQHTARYFSRPPIHPLETPILDGDGRRPVHTCVSHGLFLDAEERVIVTDSGNQVIRRTVTVLRPAGKAKTPWQSFLARPDPEPVNVVRERLFLLKRLTK